MFSRWRIIHVLEAYRLSFFATQRSLTSHFSIPYMRMFPFLIHWNVIPTSCRPTPHISRCLPPFSNTLHHKFPFKITYFSLMPRMHYLAVHWQGAFHRRYRKRCWERDRSAAMGCSQSTKCDRDPSHEPKYQTKQRTDCLLTFTRINRYPDRCHWTADVEKSRE